MDEEMKLQQDPEPDTGTPAPEPETAARELEAALDRIDALEAENRAAREEKDQAVLDYAIARTVKDSGTRDPELLELLLRRAGVKIENGSEAALEAEIAAIRRERPWLFPDGGGHPVFSAETMGRSLSRDEEAVARRYQGNPWYRRG